MRVGRNLLRGKKEKTSKGKGKSNASVKKEGEKVVCKHCSREGHEEKNCWKLHPENRPKYNNNKGKQKTAATTQHELGEDSSDETKITAMRLKNMKEKEIETKPNTSTSNCHIQVQMKKRELNYFM